MRSLECRQILRTFPLLTVSLNRPLVRQYAAEKGCTPAQFALAWLMAQKPWIVPIPGTTKLHRLQENLAADQVSFSPEELSAVQAALDQIPIHGARYNDQQERLVER